VATVALTSSLQSAGKSARLAAGAIEFAGDGETFDLATLDAAALLGRARDGGVDHALAAVAAADILVVVTPVYRATYSGLLKVFFDLLPAHALAQTVSVLVASGGSGAHFLAVDTGMRALIASLDGWAVPATVYATPDDFDGNGDPKPEITDRLRLALHQATLVAGAINRSARG
jgi:FMN reductase